jgi:hypothetical protein
MILQLWLEHMFHRYHCTLSSSAEKLNFTNVVYKVSLLLWLYAQINSPNGFSFSLNCTFSIRTCFFGLFYVVDTLLLISIDVGNN